MSETPQDSAETQDEPWPAENSGGGTRKLVLYGLLALMVVALAYDYLIARPAVNAAYDQIAEASIKANGKGVGFLSNQDVRGLVGKEPVQTFMDGGFSVEVFQWRGGLIVKPHKLYTVYMKNGDGWMFNRHAKFVYEPSSSVTPDRPLVPVDDDEPPASYDEVEMSGGGGGGGGRPEAEAPETEGPAVERLGPNGTQPPAAESTETESPAESPAETEAESEPAE